MVAMLGVVYVGSSGLHLWPVALDIFCKSKSILFNLRFDHLLRPMNVFRRDVYDALLLRCYLWGFCFFFFFCPGHRVEDGIDRFGGLTLTTGF
jgi:hypothetical protein